MKKTKKSRQNPQRTPFAARAKNLFNALRSRKWLLPGLAGAILLVLASLFLFSWITRPKNPGIAFYRIPENVAQVITQTAKDSSFAGETEFIFLTLDDSLPLEEQVLKLKNRISLLFAPAGQASAALASRTHAPSERIRRLLPTTIRNAGITGKTAYALPVLLDHFELAYNRQASLRCWKPPEL